MSSDSDPVDTMTLSSLESTTRRRLLGAVATAGIAGLAGCSSSFTRLESAKTTVEHQFGSNDITRLRIPDASDDVSIEQFDGEAIRVQVHKQAYGETSLSELALRSQVADDTLALRTHKTDVVGIGGGSINLEISVPETVSVDLISTDDGDVALHGTSGQTVVKNGDGDLVTTDIAGGISATTDDGDVNVEGADGIVTARSDDGDVSIHDADKIRKIRSDDGDILAVIPAVDSTATVRSDDGDVVVRLGDSVDATVEVTVDDGQITLADVLGKINTTTEHRVEAVLGNGENELTIHADDGDVTITPI